MGEGEVMPSGWCRMIEALESLVDIVQHCKVDCSFFVVAVKGESAVGCASPISGNFVNRGDDIHEVFGILLAFM
jgi:hypothetical protein